MATDIVLDDAGKEWIALEATAIKTTAADLIMDCPLRHKGKPGLRRALVHDQADGLTLNFNRDYPGGLTLNDTRVRLKVHLHIGRQPALPRRAVVGELYAVSCVPIELELRESLLTELDHALDEHKPRETPFNRALAGLRDDISRPQPAISLWLCIGTNSFGSAVWQRISLADTLDGTL